MHQKGQLQAQLIYQKPIPQDLADIYSVYQMLKYADFTFFFIVQGETV